MVYDCFAFFNELDLLELRLNELNSAVDRFVLVESTRTFQKNPKPLYYLENKERFKEFHHKIIHIVVDKFPGFWYKFRVPNSWDYDNYQKDQISQGLKNCSPQDVIIFSDLDEIPNPHKIREFKDKEGIKVFQQRHFYYYMNCIEVEPNDLGKYKWWYGSVMTHFKNFTTARKLRIQRDINRFKNSIVIPDAGWHFAYQGGVQKIIQKLEAYTHVEHNKEDFKDPVKIKELIVSGKSLYGDSDMRCVFEKVGSSYPEYLQSHTEKFKEHILLN